MAIRGGIKSSYNSGGTAMVEKWWVGIIHGHVRLGEGRKEVDRATNG